MNNIFIYFSYKVPHEKQSVKEFESHLANFENYLKFVSAYPHCFQLSIYINFNCENDGINSSVIVSLFSFIENKVTISYWLFLQLIGCNKNL